MFSKKIPFGYLMALFSYFTLVACGHDNSEPAVGGNSSLYDSPSPKVEKQKVGRPYQIKGIWYTPEINDTYDETGIASWYGPGFHGKSTSNGEVFDENKVSAAHKTLPLPSYVEVTNLDNGKKLYVRVNDRGPFADDRIIDLSKQAAEVLGSRATGLARVRVRMAQPPKNITLLAPNGRKVVGKGYKPSYQPVMIANQTSDNAVAEDIYKPVLQSTYHINSVPQTNYMNSDEQAISGSGYAVRVGLFGDPDNITKLQKSLAPYGQVVLKPVIRNGQQLSEVSLAGYPSRQKAVSVVDALAGIGINDSIVVAQ